ncbi:MAG: hypothetical protein GY870_03260 [archaeon]|nr:hypothetical protein [archaeon]
MTIIKWLKSSQAKGGLKLSESKQDQENYIKIADGTTWPNPRDDNEIEWKLRHSKQPLTDNERMVVSSIMHAYSQLIHIDNKTRNKKCNMIKNIEV